MSLSVRRASSLNVRVALFEEDTSPNSMFTPLTVSAYTVLKRASIAPTLKDEMPFVTLVYSGEMELPTAISSSGETTSPWRITPAWSVFV